MISKPTSLLALALAAFAGCCSSEQARRQELGLKTDTLWGNYFNEGRDQARRSIVEANHVIEEVKLPNFEENRAFALFLDYGRLYSIDYRAGSNALAQADLIKARYWSLRTCELSGDTPDASIRHVDKFAGPDKLLDFIDKWDEGVNHGKQPRYIDHP
jgi:hypothetical protein